MKNVEEICSKVHLKFITEKRAQGYHAPSECPVWSESPLKKMWSGRDERRHCEKCMKVLYPWDKLGENGEYKNGLRWTVEAVLGVIEAGD